MTDVVSPQVRSRMMSGSRGKNTRPELLIRRSLHRLGYRYRLHSNKLPSKPDLVFPRYRAVIFVNGCFWHGHDCHLFKWPSSPRRMVACEDYPHARDRCGQPQGPGRGGLAHSGCMGVRAEGKRTRQPLQQVIGQIDAWLPADSARAGDSRQRRRCAEARVRLTASASARFTLFFGLTLNCSSTTTPAASSTQCERMTPMYLRPYIERSPHAPQASSTSCCGSLSRS